MKKSKKLLTAALAAVMTASMGSVSASAVDAPAVNRIDLSIGGLVIEDSGIMLCQAGKKPISAAIVKMANGAELKADESRYEVEKLSSYQLKAMKLGNGFDGISDKDKGLNSFHDYYVVKFNKNSDSDNIVNESEDSDSDNILIQSEERNLLCNELLESGKAEYVKPTMIGSFTMPSNGYVTDYLKGEDVDSSGFSDKLFGFTLTFASAEDAQNFKPDSVADFAENLYVSRIKDNVMYFQLNEGVKGKAMAKVFCSLQKSEAVNNVGAVIGVMPFCVFEIAVSPNSTIYYIPEDHLLGDTDRNNKIDLYDAINIAKHMSGVKELDELQQILADYNEDGKIDLYDAIGIAKYMAKKNKK